MSFNVRATEISLLWRLTLVEAELINSLNFSSPGTCVSWTWRGTSSQPCHAGPCSWTCSTSMSRTTSCTHFFGRSTHRTSHRCYIVSDLASPYIWALKKHWINLFLYFPVSYLIFFPLLSCVPLNSLPYTMFISDNYLLGTSDLTNSHQDT